MSRSGWEVAKHAAWHEFGQRHWRTITLGPYIASFVGKLVIVGAVLGVGYWGYQHDAPVEHWLARWFVTCVVVALCVSGYAVTAFFIWRHAGWHLYVYGLNAVTYTLGVTLIGLFVLGVVTIAGGLS